MAQCTIPVKSKVASFDVDCQYTFTPECPAELPVPDGTAIVNELNQQAGYAAYRLGSKDAHSPKAIWVADDKHPPLSTISAANADVRWPKHAVPGTKGFELIAGLPQICDYDFFVWKGVELDMHPYGACYHDLANTLSTGVIEFLCQQQVTTIIVGGLATEYCVKNTVLQLLTANFAVIVNLGACRGIDNKNIEQAKTEMLTAGACLITTAADIREENP